MCIIIIGVSVFLKKDKDIVDMDPKKLPDVMAFQDEFTRGFMKSTKEVEDGYYLFESGTGGYTMLYPEDARMDHIYYERTKESVEHIKFGGDNEKITGDNYTIYALYDFGSIAREPDSLLYLLSNGINYKGENDKIEYDDRIIYFATMKYTTKSKRQSTYRFFGVIQSKDIDQAVSYRYNVHCKDESKGCSYDLEAVENEVMKIMESVEFKVN